MLKTQRFWNLWKLILNNAILNELCGPSAEWKYSISEKLILYGNLIYLGKN